jgi:hypothetical protein
MQGETKERWQELCRQAEVEQDPIKLLALVKEIDQLLLEKEERLLNARLPLPLLCSICNQPVSLEADKDTDDYGKPVHESCYANKLTQDDIKRR